MNVVKKIAVRFLGIKNRVTGEIRFTDFSGVDTITGECYRMALNGTCKDGISEREFQAISKEYPGAFKVAVKEDDIAEEAAPVAVVIPPRYKAPDRVSIGMASIPRRVIYLEKIVAGLLPQVDMIHICLNGYKEIPSFLDHEKIDAFIPSSQLGAAGKLSRVYKESGYVLCCDDDVNYPPDYVERMVKSVERYERKAIVSASGLLFPPDAVDYIG